MLKKNKNLPSIRFFFKLSQPNNLVYIRVGVQVEYTDSLFPISLPQKFKKFAKTHKSLI